MLHVYSQTEGRLALQVYGANGKHKLKASYQPLSVVEITYDNNPTRPISAVSTIDPAYLPDKLYDDIRRQSIAIFVTEMLMLTLTHPMRDEQMYKFIVDFVHELNDTSSPENLHIQFMLRLAELLGIGSPEIAVQRFDDANSHGLVRTERQQILRQLCDYYLEHVESFRMPKSLDILIEIFN